MLKNLLLSTAVVAALSTPAAAHYLNVGPAGQDYLPGGPGGPDMGDVSGGDTTPIAQLGQWSYYFRVDGAGARSCAAMNDSSPDGYLFFTASEETGDTVVFDSTDASYTKGETKMILGFDAGALDVTAHTDGGLFLIPHLSAAEMRLVVSSTKLFLAGTDQRIVARYDQLRDGKSAWMMVRSCYRGNIAKK